MTSVTRTGIPVIIMVAWREPVGPRMKGFGGERGVDPCRFGAAFVDRMASWLFCSLIAHVSNLYGNG